MNDGAGGCGNGLADGVGLTSLVRHEKTVLDAIKVGFEVCLFMARDMRYCLTSKIGRASCRAQLSENDESFRAPYDGSTDLEAYFNGIEDCLFMADKASQPYSVGQTLTAASSAIIQSQRFPLAMREWHKLPPLARTCAAFKATLLKEQKTRETTE